LALSPGKGCFSKQTVALFVVSVAIPRVPAWLGLEALRLKLLGECAARGCPCLGCCDPVVRPEINCSRSRRLPFLLGAVEYSGHSGGRLRPKISVAGSIANQEFSPCQRRTLRRDWAAVSPISAR